MSSQPFDHLPKIELYSRMSSRVTSRVTSPIKSENIKLCLQNPLDLTKLNFQPSTPSLLMNSNPLSLPYPQYKSSQPIHLQISDILSSMTTKTDKASDNKIQTMTENSQESYLNSNYVSTPSTTLKDQVIDESQLYECNNQNTITQFQMDTDPTYKAPTRKTSVCSNFQNQPTLKLQNSVPKLQILDINSLYPPPPTSLFSKDDQLKQNDKAATNLFSSQNGSNNLISNLVNGLASLFNKPKESTTTTGQSSNFLSIKSNSSQSVLDQNFPKEKIQQTQNINDNDKENADPGLKSKKRKNKNQQKLEANQNGQNESQNGITTSTSAMNEENQKMNQQMKKKKKLNQQFREIQDPILKKIQLPQLKEQFLCFPKPPYLQIGDWFCQGCKNWNWARRKMCNVCKQFQITNENLKIYETDDTIYQTLDCQASLDKIVQKQQLTYKQGDWVIKQCFQFVIQNIFIIIKFFRLLILSRSSIYNTINHIDLQIMQQPEFSLQIKMQQMRLCYKH